MAKHGILGLADLGLGLVTDYKTAMFDLEGRSEFGFALNEN